MSGGLGDDTYVVESSADIVTESASGGRDTIESSISWVLGMELEDLTLTGASSIDATGNVVANTLRGNNANNILDGLAGADTLIGGAGDDTYVVDNAADSVVESMTEGTDTVRTNITYTLTTNVENLVMMGSASINATGNTVANILTGNSGDNVLNGGGGSDMMIGGLGNDTYVVDAAGDVVSEQADAGTDLVQSSFDLCTDRRRRKLVADRNCCDKREWKHAEQYVDRKLCYQHVDRRCR